MRFRDKVVLVTGASSGIGAAVARAFADEGAAVSLCARRADRLVNLAREIETRGGRALVVHCDVTKPADLSAAIARTTSELGRLDVVVANAGFAVVGGIDRLELDDYRRQFETNVFGVIATVKAALPALTDTAGQIVFISSVVGRVPIPKMSAYVASKHAVAGLADSLRTELSQQGIGVTLVCPSYVKSELQQVDKYGVFDPNRPSTQPKNAADADACARAIVRATAARKRELDWPLQAKAIVFAGRHLPGLWNALMRRKRKRTPSPAPATAAP